MDKIYIMSVKGINVGLIAESQLGLIHSNMETIEKALWCHFPVSMAKLGKGYSIEYMQHGIRLANSGLSINIDIKPSNYIFL